MTAISPGSGPEPLASYPPEAYSEPLQATAAPKSTWWLWLALPAISGLLVGILWWLAAPGGAFYAKGTDYNIWLPRDLVLGGLGVLAGLVAVLLFLLKGRRAGGASKSALIALAVGSALGSLLAWRTGVFMGSLFQTPPQPLLSPSILFSLRAHSVLLLWPLTVALLTFVVTFLGQMGNGSRPKNEG